MDDAAPNVDRCMIPTIASDAANGCERTDGVRPFSSTSIVRIVTNNTDELAEALLDWNVEMTQLRPGAFECDISIIPLGPALICHGRHNQWLLERLTTPADCLTVARPGRGSDPVTVAGHEIEDGDVFVSGPGAEGETVSHGWRFPSTVSIQMHFLESQSRWLHSATLRSAGRVQLHSAGKEWTDGFLDAMAWIADAALRYGQAVARPEISASLVDLLVARVDALRAIDSPLSHDREERAARRVAVARAREYIRVNLTEPIRLSDLCTYARTQARSLEYGFREVMGVSPITYVRATRLHLVRKLLRSTAVRTRSISEIALDCGFWHLSQFAMDYKHLFTESPSTTYRRTQSQLPPSDRRRTAVSASLATKGRVRRVIPALS